MNDAISVEKCRKKCEKVSLLKMLAAFIDGEGTIGVYKVLGINNKYVYQQTLSLVNTDIRLIVWLVDNFGGKLANAVKHEENWKDTYTWKLSSYKSYKLIKKIRPYLLLKQEQADCAIELYEKVSKWKYVTMHPMPDYKRKIADDLYKRNIELNKKGKYNNITKEKICYHILKTRRVIETLEEYI